MRAENSQRNFTAQPSEGPENENERGAIHAPSLPARISA